MYDITIKNCQIVDGSGAPAFLGDIAIQDGRFSRIAERIDEPAEQVVNGAGLYAAPGFVDIHRHSDAFVFREGYGEVQLRQGITTTVNGNCGLSIAPCPAAFRQDILAYLKPIIGTLPDDVSFETFPEYLEAVSHVPLPINFGMLVGNGTLRAAAKGYEPGRLDGDELSALHRYLEEAIEAGAFGVSMGLIYAPENNYDVPGFIEALAPLRGTDIPLLTHMRGEGSMLLDSLREVIAIARGLGTPLHISHFKAVGAINWRHMREKAIAIIEQERAAGMDITVDVYPWEAGSSLLAQVLPPEFQEGGLAEAARRLRDPAERARCRAILEGPPAGFENQVKLLGWENIMVGSVKTDKNRECEGKRISEIAAMRNQDPYDAALGLLADEDCEVSMINFIACDEDIEAIMKLPYSYIISDSIYPDGGKPHPRQYGTYPKLLADYVRDRQVLRIEEAIHKCTQAPADRLRIAGKGRIDVGYDADLVLFDLTRVENHASYLEPRGLGTGFRLVLVNGQIGNEDDNFTNPKSGRVLRRGAVM